MYTINCQGHGEIFHAADYKELVNTFFSKQFPYPRPNLDKMHKELTECGVFKYATGLITVTYIKGAEG